MLLIDLPVDILLLLPEHLDGLQTLLRLKATCRAMYDTLERTTPNIILRLVTRSEYQRSRRSPSFQCSLYKTPPLAHVIALIVASQVADWAVGDGARTSRLKDAFAEGSRGIVDLGLEVAGLSLADAKAFFDKLGRAKPRDDIQKPKGYHLRTALDRAATCIKQFGHFRHNEMRYDDEPFRSDIGIEVVYHMAIYGELFKSSMKACMTPGGQHPRFGADVRQAYLVGWSGLPQAKAAYFLGQTCHQQSNPRPLTSYFGKIRAKNQIIKMNAFCEALRDLSSNQVWQMKWRTALHRAGVLSSRSTNEQDFFWISTMQSCGIAGFDTWSNLLDPRSEKRSNKGRGSVRWAEERRAMVQEIQQYVDRSQQGSNEGSWPDFHSDVRAFLAT